MASSAILHTAKVARTLVRAENLENSRAQAKACATHAAGMPSALENHHRHAQFSRVRQREHYVAHAQFGGDFFRYSVQQ